MRGIILGVALAVCGCSGAAEPSPSKPAPSPGSSISLPERDSSDTGGPCGVAGTVQVINGMQVFVPALCNPGWFDPSDPPPYTDHMDLVDIEKVNVGLPASR